MIAQFALMLLCGMSLMWAVMPRAQVTAGFFRIQMLITLGLSVLAFLTAGRLLNNSDESTAVQFVTAARVVIGVMAFVAYVGSVFWTLDRRPVGTACLLVILAGSVTSLILSQGDPAPWSHQPGLMLLLSRLSTAAVLGGAVTGMLLGHWYLTAPTMSIEPLKRLSLVFGIAVTARLLVSLVGWFLAGDRLQTGTQLTWFALRWLAGIIGPLVIAWMALRILRYRNTQAATGVLFAGVILTFIGEMSAALLFSELKVPL